jgi:phosphatidylglycerophosphatase A
VTDVPPSPHPWHDPIVWVATGLGVGRSPILPGTLGTLWGVPLAWGIGQLPGMPLQVGIIAVLGLIGVPLCARAARQLGTKDPGSVVFDEIVSLPIVFLGVPPELLSHPGVLLSGFVLHRVFDIGKPPPISRFERLPGGLGIMADDWMAAAYSCLCLHLGLWAIG